MTRDAPPEDSGRRKLIVAGIIAGTITLLVLFTLLGLYLWASRGLPDISGKARGRDQTTVVYDRKGRVITKLFAEQNRTDIKLQDIPAALRQGVVATEDERFYRHRGVDPLAIMRALVVDIRKGSTAQGGSTITQQYVKNAFVTDERTLKRKLQEALLSQRLERRLGKDRILELYLNTIYFGHGSYGVETAAQTYFGKHAEQLSVAEAAMLAGVIKSPGRYSPYLDPNAAKDRRDTVLKQMLDQGYLDQPAYSAVASTPINTAGLKRPAGNAPYFVEYVKAQIGERFGPDAVYRGGLRVRTTLDLELQRAAERAVRDVLDRPGDPSAALVALDPKTGAILALVGGRDFKRQQFDVATQGHRQPGSAFKPMVLVAAIEASMSVESTFDAGLVSIPIPGQGPWRVTGSRRGPMRLRVATEKSVNSVFAQLIMDIGAQAVADTARRMGVRTKLTPVPAIALGGVREGVTPLEMTNAFATLAAGGIRSEPFAIVSVTDRAGKSLLATKPKRTRVLDAAVAFLATDVLRGVVERGTGTAADIGRPVAGKTGTSQENRDAWFIGYTPQVVAGVWIGFPESQRAMSSVHGQQVTGGSLPARIWASFMRSAMQGVTRRSFVEPSGLVHTRTCSDSGLRATEYCPNTFRGTFLAGTPLALCPIHAQPTEIRIPNVVGMTKEAALAALTKLLLGYRIVERPSADIPLGVVASQTPAAGSVGTTRTVVTLVVSKGDMGTGQPPVARFTVSPDPAAVGQQITFDASDSSAKKSSIVKWVWEFGDGSTGTGRTATHAFAAAGSYDVTLWITNDKGVAATATKTVVVQ